MKENIRNVNEKLKEKIKNTRLNRTKEYKNKTWDFTMCRTHDQIKNKTNICKWKNIEEYCAEIYEIDSYYYEYYKKNKSWWKWS